MIEGGHVSIHVQAQATLSQSSATTPLAGGEAARGSLLFPVLPCPWCSTQTGPKQLEQDSGAGAGQHSIWGFDSFLLLCSLQANRARRWTSAPAHSHPYC